VDLVADGRWDVTWNGSDQSVAGTRHRTVVGYRRSLEMDEVASRSTFGHWWEGLKTCAGFGARGALRESRYQARFVS
jgi:hypothetical protein